LRLEVEKAAAVETAEMFESKSWKKGGAECISYTCYVLGYLHSPFEAFERSFNLYRFQLKLP